jgi:hypothetical protein
VRSAEQIGRTVEQYHEWQRAERRKHLAAFLAMCRQARERGDEWLRWLESGRPRYTDAEYAEVLAAQKAKP